VSPGARPVFERGVRLRTDADGSTMLLVPEGAITLNTSAAAALALVDGNRTLDEIITQICARFEVDERRARDDITTLFERLRSRRMLVLA
jgi:coenzyme PQQ biosynthesis protein PqqD